MNKFILLCIAFTGLLQALTLNGKKIILPQENFYKNNKNYKYINIESTSDLDIDISSQKHSPLMGYAKDGYPIYALYGYANTRDENSKVIEMISGYRIQFGSREKGDNSPKGYFDGSYESDFIYDRTKGNLDKCNGRFTVTPEFPRGTYAYFLTDSWPVIPRCSIKDKLK